MGRSANPSDWLMKRRQKAEMSARAQKWKVTTTLHFVSAPTLIGQN
jgi:hypothetical protein